MSALNRPPDPSTYTYVLRKKREIGHVPWLENLVVGYDESARTRDITHGDGRRAQTVFIRGEFFRQRLLCMGQWEDVTTLWNRSNYPNGRGDYLDPARRAAELAAEVGGIISLPDADSDPDADGPAPAGQAEEVADG